MVVLGLQEGVIPRLPQDLHEEEKEEEINSFRRLFYVSITRAMRGVLVLYPEASPSCFVQELEKEYWNRD